MRRILLLLALCLAPLSALADATIDRVVQQVVLPSVARFAETTRALADAARAECRAEDPALRAAWNAAMDAWIGVEDLRLGPLENNGRRLTIAYWPDPTGNRPKALTRILSGADPVLATPEKYQGESIAARGIFALETLLYDPAFNGYGPDDPGCALVRLASADLADQAQAVRSAWAGDFQETISAAGQGKKSRFLDESEVVQAIFTGLATGLQFDIDERLGQPLGTADHPRPLRAEDRLSGRSLRNLVLSLAAHQELARALVHDPAATAGSAEGFARVRALAEGLDDPVFAGVADPAGRARVAALQSALIMLKAAVVADLTAALGVKLGLNAMDGD